MRSFRSASDSMSVGDMGSFSSLERSMRSLRGSCFVVFGGRRKLENVSMSGCVKSRPRQHNGIPE